MRTALGHACTAWPAGRAIAERSPLPPPLSSAAVCPEPSPTNVLQLLAAGVFLHVTGAACVAGSLAALLLCGTSGSVLAATPTHHPPATPAALPAAGNSEPAIAMLSAALSGVWPLPRALQRRLVERQFVPTAEPDGDAAAAAAAAGDAAAGTAGPSSVAGTQQEAADEEAQPTPAAAALAEALRQHCPSISLQEIEKSALELRLFLGCRAVGQQAGDSPSLQVWGAPGARAGGWPLGRQLGVSLPCHAANNLALLHAGHRANAACGLPAADVPGPKLCARVCVGGAGGDGTPESFARPQGVRHPAAGHISPAFPPLLAADALRAVAPGQPSRGVAVWRGHPAQPGGQV